MKLFTFLLTIILCITLVGCGDFGDPTISVDGDDVTQTDTSSDVTSSEEEQQEEGENRQGRKPEGGCHQGRGDQQCR